MNATSLRLFALIAASVGLGLAYNVNHPAGIRFGAASQSPSAGAAERISAQTTPDKSGHFTHKLISSEWMGSLPAAGLPEAVHAEGQVRRVTWQEARDLIENKSAVLLDVRDASAFEVGHIPGAVSAPLKEIATDPTALQGRFPQSMPLILYCDNANCPQSRTAASLLQQRRHFAQIYYLPGGFLEWRSAQSSR